MIERPSSLPPGYELREMSEEEIALVKEKLLPEIFSGPFFHIPYLNFTDEELAHLARLRDKLSGRVLRHLGIFRGKELAAWSWGMQRSPQEFEMYNSAVLAAHRRRGLYSALLKETIRWAVEAGFQTITSAHNATNNDVIIPKLQAGFMIAGWQLEDEIGSLVRLAYYVNPERRRILQMRSGQIRPDDAIKKLMGL